VTEPRDVTLGTRRVNRDWTSDRLQRRAHCGSQRTMLFGKVKYFLSTSIPEDTRLRLRNILDSLGAKSVAIEDATHVISNTLDFEGSTKMKKGTLCITVSCCMARKRVIKMLL